MNVLRKIAAPLAALTVVTLLFGAYVTSANASSPSPVSSLTEKTGSSMAFNAMPPGSLVIVPTVPDGMGMDDPDPQQASGHIALGVTLTGLVLAFVFVVFARSQPSRKSHHNADGDRGGHGGGTTT